MALQPPFDQHTIRVSARVGIREEKQWIWPDGVVFSIFFLSLGHGQSQALVLRWLVNFAAAVPFWMTGRLGFTGYGSGSVLDGLVAAL